VTVLRTPEEHAAELARMREAWARLEAKPASARPRAQRDCGDNPLTALERRRREA
jgi:hypothetical protein